MCNTLNSLISPKFRKLYLVSHLPILIIIAVSLAIRLAGVNFGLPYLYDPDEPLFVERSVRMIEWESPHPYWFSVPASTTMYILAATYSLFLIGGLISGHYVSKDAFLHQYYSDPTIFYLSGRIEIVIFAVLSVLFLYFLGNKLFNKRIGLIAAGLLAVTPIHVEVSRLIRPDIEMTFLVMLVFWFCLRILDQPKWRDYTMAGFVLGLGIVTKYPAAIAASMILFAHLFASKNMFAWRKHIRLLGAGVGTLLGVFLGSPIIFFSLNQVVDGLKHENRSSQLSGTGEGLLKNAIYYTDMMLNKDIFIIGGILLLIGMFYILRSRKPSYILLLTFPIVFILSISNLSLRAHRWIIPVTPFIALIMAYGFSRFSDFLIKLLNHRLAYVLATALLIFVFINPSIAVFSQARQLMGDDTRTIAGHWIIENLPKGSSLLLDNYSPQLPVDQFQYYTGWNNLEWLDPKNQKNSFAIPTGHMGTIDTNQIIASKVQYIVLTDIYDRYLDEASTYPREVANYKFLIAHSNLLYQIQPIPGQIDGPTIRIYKLNK